MYNINMIHMISYDYNTFLTQCVWKAKGLIRIKSNIYYNNDLIHIFLKYIICLCVWIYGLNRVSLRFKITASYDIHSVVVLHQSIDINNIWLTLYFKKLVSGVILYFCVKWNFELKKSLEGKIQFDVYKIQWNTNIVIEK